MENGTISEKGKLDPKQSALKSLHDSIRNLASVRVMISRMPNADYLKPSVNAAYDMLSQIAIAVELYR